MPGILDCLDVALVGVGRSKQRRFSGVCIGSNNFYNLHNDIDEGITCKISKFADDTKIANKVNSETKPKLMQNYSNALVDWSKI